MWSMNLIDCSEIHSDAPLASTNTQHKPPTWSRGFVQSISLVSFFWSWFWAIASDCSANTVNFVVFLADIGWWRSMQATALQRKPLAQLKPPSVHTQTRHQKESPAQ
jgi:hypothetical protein